MCKLDKCHPVLKQGYYICYYADTEKQRCCYSFVAQEDRIYLVSDYSPKAFWEIKIDTSETWLTLGVQSCPINMDSKYQIIWSWKNLMKNVEVNEISHS